MEEDKRYPDSRSPSPWPSWLEDEALSGQWEGAVGGSDLSLPRIGERTLVNVDGDWKHDMDPEPSQCGDANTWEEHGTRQELYPLEAVRVQEHPQWGARRIPGLDQGEEPVRVQELHQWEEDGVRYQEMIEWEDDGMRYKQLTQWEGGVRYQELIHREVGVRYQEVTQWEVDGVIYQELTQCDEHGEIYQELTRWEGNVTVVPSSVGTEGAAETARALPSVAPAPLSPTDTELGAAALDGATEEEEPLSAEEEKAETSTAFQEQVPPAGTASDAPAPQSPSEGSQALLDTDQHISPDILSQAELDIQGSGQEPEEKRELEQSLAAEREAAAGAEREESPVPAAQSPCCLFCPLFISVSSQVHCGQQTAGAAQSGLAGQETKEEAFAEDENDWKFYDELELCKRQDEEEGRGYQGLIQWHDDIGPELSEEEVQRPSKQPQREGDSDTGLALEDREHLAVHNIEVQPLHLVEGKGKELSTVELSQGEGREERLRMPGQEELSVPTPEGEGGSVLAGQHTEEEVFAEDENEWKFYDELELCKRQFEKESRGYQELFEWEGDIGPELSEEEDGSPSVPSQWEDDSDIGRALEDWEYMTVHNIEVRPWSPEEDEWEELSVLELSEGEGREERLAMAGAEGLSVPAPREAWAERRAPEPCPAVPVCVCPAQLAAQCPRGAAACAALEEQGAEAGTRSQGPAPQSPCCPPSPSPAQLQPQALSGQPAVPKERPSRVRRALRALRSLFRSCLRDSPRIRPRSGATLGPQVGAGPETAPRPEGTARGGSAGTGAHGMANPACLASAPGHLRQDTRAPPWQRQTSTPGAQLGPRGSAGHPTQSPGLPRTSRAIRCHRHQHHHSPPCHMSPGTTSRRLGSTCRDRDCPTDLGHSWQGLTPPAGNEQGQELLLPEPPAGLRHT